MKLSISLKTVIPFFAMLLFAGSVQSQPFLKKVKNTYEKGKDAVEKADKTVSELTGTGNNTKAKQPAAPSTQSSSGSTKQPASSNNNQPAPTGSVQHIQQTSLGCTVLSFHPNIAVSVDSCVGNKTSQTATVYFKVRHQLPHQSLSMSIANNTQAYDSEGNIRNAESGSIGGRRETYSVTDRIPTGVKIPCTITFSNIVDFKNPSLQSVFIQCYAAEANGGGNAVEGQIEINNLPIKWQ